MFMSEQEAIAIIEKNIDKIEAKMASGSSAVSMLDSSGGSAGGNQPCNGTCDGDPNFGGQCCNCCMC